MSGNYNQSSLRAARSQANYLFEGDFRRRPNQNLSGASRSLDRVQLLQQAALQRQNREDIRRKELSSVKIQSSWRGYQCRKSLRSIMIEKFDRLVVLQHGSICDQLDIETFGKIIQEFILLYHSKLDKNRLTALIQVMMAQKQKIKAFKDASHDWLFRIIKLLIINIKYLDSECGSADSPYVRFLECFTSHDFLDQNEHEIFWMTLCRVKLFTALRSMIDRQYLHKQGIDDKSENQLNRMIIEIIRRSLNFEATRSYNSTTNPICLFFTEFLKGPLNPLLKDHYIPKILFLKPSGLQPQSVLGCFKDPREFIPKHFDLSKDSATSNNDLIKNCVEAVWLSYAFVKNIHSQIDRICDEEKANYLNTLSVFVSPAEYLLNLNLLQGSREESQDIDDDDDDNDNPHQVDLATSNSDAAKATFKEVKGIITEIVAMINDQSHVNSLKSILFNHDMHPHIQAAIIKICNFTLAHEHLAIFNCPLLYTIAFSWEFLRKLWKSIVSVKTTSLFGQSTPIYIQIRKGDTNISHESWEAILPRLKLFCSLYSYLLPTLDDEEFYSSDHRSILESDNMLQREKSDSRNTYFIDRELVGISAVLRDISVGLIDILYHENKSTYHLDFAHEHHSTRDPRSDMLSFNIRSCFKAIVRLVCQIHARDSRKQFCSAGHWICTSAVVPTNKVLDFQLITSQEGRLLDRVTRVNFGDRSSTSPSEIKAILILQELPFVTPFQDRVQMFHQLIAKEKRAHMSEGYHFGLPDTAIQVQIRRNYIYEDAFHKLSDGKEPNMKLPLKVSLINAVGATEAGIDGGGVSKEFLSELLKAGFDPMRGFFKSTKDHELYPNPSAKVLFSSFPEGYEIHFEFLGKMLGKAIFEKVMVELPFASFFLAKILARHNPSDVDWHNLASLDPVLYKNLVYLKNYKGDVADLNLDFTITNNELDEREVVELKPGGSKIPVNKDNKVEYVHLVADYRLNKQIRAQCAAFKKGLSQLIDLDWLRMFDPRELQILISGAPTLIDMEDWKRHTVYANGYSDDSEVILTFWRVASNMDEVHKRKLLKFATSCSNPPLLGFRDLYPQFTIAPSEGTRLPTASTCMNLLKLPECRDENVMRSKLLYAIDSNSGFELS